MVIPRMGLFGSTQTKDEVIIAQNASGDANASSSITRAEWMIVGLLVLLLLVALWFGMRRYQKHLRRVVQNEIALNEMRKSRELI